MSRTEQGNLYSLLITLLSQPPFVVRAQNRARQQVRPSLTRTQQGLPAPPAGDLGVIAGQQHLWHAQAPELFGARILRILQQPVAERFFFGRFFATHHPGDQARDGVDDHQGRDLATTEDIITDRDLFVHERADAFVYPLIPTTDEDKRLPT